MVLMTPGQPWTAIDGIPWLVRTTLIPRAPRKVGPDGIRGPIFSHLQGFFLDQPVILPDLCVTCAR